MRHLEGFQPWCRTVAGPLGIGPLVVASMPSDAVVAIITVNEGEQVGFLVGVIRFNVLDCGLAA